MTTLSLCEQIRRTPFAFLAERSAFALAEFFTGFLWANDAIATPLARISDQFPGPQGLLVATRANLTSMHAEHSFERLLDALEDDLRHHGEPPPGPVQRDVPLLAAIVKVIDDRRTGIFLLEPTTACLYNTLQGHWCGIAEYDPEEARRQRAPLDVIAARVRETYPAATAPWYVVLRIAEGSGMRALQELSRLYHELVESPASI